MNKINETEQRIRTAMEHATPDVLDHIISSCDTQKGEISIMTKTKKRKFIAAWAAAAACLILICTGVIGMGLWRVGNTVDSIIMLDVNPSLSIEVNAKERVLKVTPLNEDAEIILDGMDLKGTDLNVTINAIVGAMLQKGYLSDLQNSVLVSVENDDAEKSYNLKLEIIDAINAACNDEALTAAVVTQDITENSNLEQLAEEYNISSGKAALIQKLIEEDGTLTFVSLAPLSVNEIMLIAESRKLDAASTEKTGSVSDKAYIGADAAKEIAFDDAGVTSASVTKLEIELDCENGDMIYEVEFETADAKYEYEILAADGAILVYSKKPHGTGEQSGSAGNGSVDDSSYIGESAAKSAALSHAGVSESDVKYCNVWLEYDDGYPEYYEVEFEAGGIEYEYEIGLTDGQVLEYSKEDHSGSSGSDSANVSSYIGEKAAKNAALSHAGFSEGDVLYCEAWINYEGGHPASYGVKFGVIGAHYEYLIGLTDGQVINYWKYDASSQHHDYHNYSGNEGSGGTVDASSFIGEEAAKQAAFSDAGVEASRVSKLKCQLDHDHDQYVYEVEFKVGQTEYEYDIDAITGNVLSKEIDD